MKSKTATTMVSEDELITRINRVLAKKDPPEMLYISNLGEYLLWNRGKGKLTWETRNRGATFGRYFLESWERASDVDPDTLDEYDRDFEGLARKLGVLGPGEVYDETTSVYGVYFGKLNALRAKPLTNDQYDSRWAALRRRTNNAIRARLETTRKRATK